MHGYQPENFEWRDWLCDRDPNGNLVGQTRCDIPLDVLSASGHPQATARSVVFRLRVMHGVDGGEARGDGFLGLQPEDFPKRLTKSARPSAWPAAAAMTLSSGGAQCSTALLGLSDGPQSP